MIWDRVTSAGRTPLLAIGLIAMISLMFLFLHWGWGDWMPAVPLAFCVLVAWQA